MVRVEADGAVGVQALGSRLRGPGNDERGDGTKRREARNDGSIKFKPGSRRFRPLPKACKRKLFAGRPCGKADNPWAIP